MVLVFLQSELNGMRVDISSDKEDSKAIIAHNPSNMSRRKRIDVKLDFIRVLIRTEEVRILHVENEEQHADVPTKALWRQKIVVHHAAMSDIS